MGEAAPTHVPFADAFKVWALIGLRSFGGPAGQIGQMHDELVTKRKWIGEDRFFHALNFCMLLPGPEAMQLATYIGWMMHGTLGGIVAGLLFVLPGFLAILALSVTYVLAADAPLLVGLLFGLKAAVLAIILHAGIRIGRRAITRRSLAVVAALAFVSIFVLGVPFPFIILAAGIYGYASARGAKDPRPDVEAGPAVGWRSSLRVAAAWLAIWWLPLLALGLVVGPHHVLFLQTVFFGQVAVVSFGGAYAVLAYVAQEAVGTFGWVTPEQMLDGLGMAETTPGPLIQVVQFVAFLGAYGQPGGLDAMAAAVLASLVVTWATFAPCFLWIFLGAPYVERLRGNVRLSGALAAVTAAVVGIILNLVAWFAIHTMFNDVQEGSMLGLAAMPVPVAASLDVAFLFLASLAAGMVFVLRWGVLRTVGAMAALGAALATV